MRREHQVLQIKMDSREGDGSYVVRVAGRKKEDVKVDIDGNVARGFSLMQDVDDKSQNRNTPTPAID